jgi:hypothetical protein
MGAISGLSHFEIVSFQRATYAQARHLITPSIAHVLRRGRTVLLRRVPVKAVFVMKKAAQKSGL